MKDLILFAKDGHTHRFHQVKDLKVNDDGLLTFEYFGLSTEQQRQAQFSDYEGFSFCDEKEA